MTAAAVAAAMPGAVMAVVGRTTGAGRGHTGFAFDRSATHCTLGRSASNCFRASVCAFFAVSAVMLPDLTGTIRKTNSRGRQTAPPTNGSKGTSLMRAHTSLYNFLSTGRSLALGR